MSDFRKFDAVFYCHACEEFHPFSGWARDGKMANAVAMGCAFDGVWRWYEHRPLEDQGSVDGLSIAVYRASGDDPISILPKHLGPPAN